MSHLKIYSFVRHNYEYKNLSFFSSFRIFKEDQEFKISESVYGNNIITESNINTSISYKLNDKLSFVLDNYLTKYKSDENFSSLTTNTQESFFDQSLFKSELRSIFEINKKNKLIIGIGLTDESLRRNNFYKNKVTQSSFNYFVQYEGFIFENTNYIFGARYDQYDEYDSEFSPRFALRTQLNDNISSKISIGKGFKTPDFRQLYFNFANSSSGYSVIGFNAAKEIIDDLLVKGQISNLIISENEFEGNLSPETSISFNLGFGIKTDNNISFDINFLEIKSKI